MSSKLFTTLLGVVISTGFDCKLAAIIPKLRPPIQRDISMSIENFVKY